MRLTSEFSLTTHTPSVLPEIKQIEKVYAIKLLNAHSALRQQKFWELLWQKPENVPDGYSVVTIEQIAEMIQGGKIKTLDLQDLGEGMFSIRKKLLALLTEEACKQLKIRVDDCIHQDCSSILNNKEYKEISEFDYNIHTWILFFTASVELQYKYLDKDYAKSDLQIADEYFKTVDFILRLGVAIQSKSDKDVKDVLKSRPKDATATTIDSVFRFQFTFSKQGQLIQDIQNILRLSPRSGVLY